MPYINGHPMLMEFVGVAGSGKSTLRRMLHTMNPQIRCVALPPKSHYIIPVLKMFYNWLPLYLRHYSKTRWFTWFEIKLMCYLDCWLPYLRKRAVEDDLVVVLDPGSFYWLTALKYFGPEITRSAKFQAWWEAMCKKWLNAIDIIVWLDAPTDELIRRVLGRDEEHEAKTFSREKAIRSFDLYRQGYAELIDLVNKRRMNHVFHFKSDKTPTEEIFDQVKTVFDTE